MKGLLILLLLVCSLPASAAQMFKCSLTHNLENGDADPTVEILSRDAAVLVPALLSHFRQMAKTRLPALSFSQ